MSIRTSLFARPRTVSMGLGACMLVSLLAARPAKAYRPFDGTDGDVADTGEFELELGPLQYAQEGKDKFLLSPTVLNLGVIPRMELVLDFVPLYPRAGGPVQVTDTDVFAKYLLRPGVLQDGSGPSIAVEAGPLVPELRGQKGFGASMDLIVSERWGWLALHLNNEVQLSRRDLYFVWAESLIAEARTGAPVRPVAELTWETQPNLHSKEYGVLGGVIWSVMEGLDLDAAGRIAKLDSANVYEVRLGLTWAIPLWSHPDGEREPERSTDQAAR